jgi:PhnB protein
MSVQPIPPGSPTVIPHLTVSDAKKAIEFYKAAFGAEPGRVAGTPDGKVMHADVRIGSSVVFLNDQFGPPGPAPAGIALHLWSTDVDAAWQRAIAAGAEVVMPLANQFWGDRYGQLRDPFGHKWSLAQHVEDVSPEDMHTRMMAAFAQMKG